MIINIDVDGSNGVVLQTQVGEVLMKQPPRQVVKSLAHQGRVLPVQVPFLHSVELLCENVVHEVGKF